MRIGKAKLEVVNDDITKMAVDCIVNPANDMLWMGGGVSARIRKAGDDSIESEALARAPAEIGDAVVTGAGNLQARRVIHAVVSGQDLVVTESALGNAVKSSLKKAESAGCVSVAVPMLAGETSHIEIHIAARIIVEETVKYLINDNKTLEYTAFVEKDDSVRNIFDKALLEMFTKHV